MFRLPKIKTKEWRKRMKYYVKKYLSALTAAVLVFSMVLEPAYVVHAEPAVVSEAAVTEEVTQEGVRINASI